MKSSYPPFIKNYLKVVPSMVITMGFLTAHVVILCANRYRIDEHLKKHNHKSNRFERALRNRDDKIRYAYQSAVVSQPQDPSSKKIIIG